MGEHPCAGYDIGRIGLGLSFIGMVSGGTVGTGKMDGHGQDQADHAHFLDRDTIPYPLEDKSHLRCISCPFFIYRLVGGGL